MSNATTKSIFHTGRRIRLGIWGLGRGHDFLRRCSAVNMDVVAGCDQNEAMRSRFAEPAPQARLTGDAEEFLSWDFDAVLLATYCHEHGRHAVQCLSAGKHVLSEVTGFHTPAEGVALVDAVERSGLVYNLAENMPFTRQNLFIADRWREGLFGNLLYAEAEYNHDSRRPLTFTYGIAGPPIQPGWTLHAWRSWLHQHYYCTHSLGPIMHITGARPTRVVALPGANSMDAHVPQVKASGMASIAPSLLSLDNGGIVRNFMGSTPNDSHQLRIWGSRAAAVSDRKTLALRVGARGNGYTLEIEPEWPDYGELAEGMGHGGADFWVLYNFARQILTGEPAYWDVYRASDVTLAGIMAYRSAASGGQPMTIPDLRSKASRDQLRYDSLAHRRYDTTGEHLPSGIDTSAIADFTAVMKALIERHATDARAVIDIAVLAPHIKDKPAAAEVARSFRSRLPEVERVYRRALELQTLLGESDAGLMVSQMLDLGAANRVLAPGFPEWLDRQIVSLEAM